MTTAFLAIAGPDLPDDLSSTLARNLPFEPDRTAHRRFDWGLAFAATNSEHLVDLLRIDDGGDSGANRLSAFDGWALDRRDGKSIDASTLNSDRPAEKLTDLWRRCDGEWCALVADDSGLSAISSPIGTHHLYVSHHGSSKTTIVASRARLIWAARAKLGLPNRRDDAVLTRLLSLGYPFATYDTAVEDIRLLPSTSLLTVDISRGNKPTEHPLERLYYLPDENKKPDWEELTAVIERNLSWLSHVQKPGRAALTGGKDSRLVMAALEGSPFADRVDYYYLRAPREHADAIAAAAVADAAGLNFKRLDRPPPDNLSDALKIHIGATEGLLNAWDLKYETHDEPFLGIHGLLGGIYRRRKIVDADDPTEVARRFLPSKLNWTGILNDSALEAQRADIAGWFGQLFDLGLSPSAAADAWHLTWRLPRWMGQAKLHDGLAGIHFNPLYSLQLIHAFHNLARADQRDQRLHFELMARFAPELAALPFANANWSAQMIARSTRPDLRSTGKPVEHAKNLVGTGWQRPALRRDWDDHRQRITAIAQKLSHYVDTTRLAMALDVAEAHLVTCSRRRQATTALRAPLLTARFISHPKAFLQELFGLLTIAALDDELRDLG